MQYQAQSARPPSIPAPSSLELTLLWPTLFPCLRKLHKTDAKPPQIRFHWTQGNGRYFVQNSSAKSLKSSLCVMDSCSAANGGFRSREEEILFGGVLNWCVFFCQNQEEGTLELFQFFSETSHEYWMKDRKQKVKTSFQLWIAASVLLPSTIAFIFPHCTRKAFEPNRRGRCLCTAVLCSSFVAP